MSNHGNIKSVPLNLQKGMFSSQAKTITIKTNQVPKGRTGNDIFRRYANGLLDVDYAAHKVIELIYRYSDNHGGYVGDLMTPQEKAVLSVILPGKAVMDPKVAAVKVNLSSNEKSAVQQKVLSYMAEMANYNGGMGGGSVDGRHMTIDKSMKEDKSIDALHRKGCKCAKCSGEEIIKAGSGLGSGDMRRHHNWHITKHDKSGVSKVYSHDHGTYLIHIPPEDKDDHVRVGYAPHLGDGRLGDLHKIGTAVSADIAARMAHYHHTGNFAKGINFQQDLALFKSSLDDFFRKLDRHRSGTPDPLEDRLNRKNELSKRPGLNWHTRTSDPSAGYRHLQTSHGSYGHIHDKIKGMQYLAFHKDPAGTDQKWISHGGNEHDTPQLISDADEAVHNHIDNLVSQGKTTHKDAYKSLSKAEAETGYDSKIKVPPPQNLFRDRVKTAQRPTNGKEIQRYQKTKHGVYHISEHLGDIIVGFQPHGSRDIKNIGFGGVESKNLVPHATSAMAKQAISAHSKRLTGLDPTIEISSHSNQRSRGSQDETKVEVPGTPPARIYPKRMAKAIDLLKAHNFKNSKIEKLEEQTGMDLDNDNEENEPKEHREKVARARVRGKRA